MLVSGIVRTLNEFLIIALYLETMLAINGSLITAGSVKPESNLEDL